MSDYRVLYYPHFEPEPTWLLSTLLFVDGVNRIIPNDAKHKDSRRIADLREALSPDPAEPISTTQKDFFLEPESYDRDRMKRVFEKIIEDHKAKLTSDPKTKLNFYTIYRAKIPYEVEKLIRGTEKKKGIRLMKDIKGSYTKVEVEAQTSELILSYVANKLAKREGVDAITDYETGFAVNALDNHHIPFHQPAGFAAGCLIGAIASCQVPAEITYLSIDAYKELRHQYSGIRSVFKQLANELAQTSNLNIIENPAVFRKRLQTTVKDFVEECDDHARTQAAKKIKKWKFWGVGNLVGLASTFGGPLAALAGKTAAVGFQLIDKSVNQPTKDISEQRPHQMLCKLKQDVLKRSMVKSTLHLYT